MILARCPACQTVFRVRPEQLRAHKGAVRCGHCFSPFNALDHLIEESAGSATEAADQQGAARFAAPAPAAAVGTPETGPAPSPEKTPPVQPPSDTREAPTQQAFAAQSGGRPGPRGRADSLFVLEERNEPSERREDKHTDLPFDPEDFAFPRGPDTQPPRAESAPSARRGSGSTFDDLAAQLEFGLPDSFLTTPRRTPSPAEPAAPKPEPLSPGLEPGLAKSEPSSLEWAPLFAEGDRFAPPMERASEKAEPSATAPAFVDLPDLPAPDLQPTIQPLNERGDEPAAPFDLPTEIGLGETPATQHDAEDAPASAARAPFLGEESAPIEHFEARYGPRPRPAPARRWAWGLAIGILLGLLAAQLAYVFRDDIARRWPQLRPAYEALCAELGCVMALPRIAGAISIESSDLQSDPVEPGRFLLNAVVRNRASHVQALPHLELTLTDARDRPLVRRVFPPEEWTPDTDIAHGFPAGEDLAARILFSAPGVEAAGYRVYVFYP